MQRQAHANGLQQDNAVTDQWRVYQECVGCLSSKKPLRMMMQASATVTVLGFSEKSDFQAGRLVYLQGGPSI